MTGFLVPIYAALAGAIGAGLLKAIDQYLARRRRRESTLVALASEVLAIRDLIRSQGYFDQYAQLAKNIRNGTWDGTTYVIDIQQNYFSVYEALAAELGLLNPTHVSKIVSFYSYCKSVIDATRPDSPVNSSENSELSSNIIGVEGVLMAITILADEIVQFPKKPLPVLEDND